MLRAVSHESSLGSAWCQGAKHAVDRIILKSENLRDPRCQVRSLWQDLVDKGFQEAKCTQNGEVNSIQRSWAFDADHRASCLAGLVDPSQLKLKR